MSRNSILHEFRNAQDGYMMARRGVIGMLAALGSVTMLAGCGLFGKSVSYRYRMTVEVETPQGLKSGSSVIQVVQTEQQGLEGSHLDVRVTGEAVAVDLPGGQTVFALLDGKPVAAITVRLPDKDADWYQIGKQIEGEAGVYDVPRAVSGRRGEVSLWPTLVRFRDIHDPKTVEKVDPDNAAAQLGAGVRIKRIMVQITDDAVTNGIEKRFVWWKKYIDFHFDGTSTTSEDMLTSNLTAHLTSANFSTEYRK